jgi:D-alanine-D-alanine ligase
VTAILGGSRAEFMFSKGTTALITGGAGPEREGSLLSGRDVETALRGCGFSVEVIDLQSVDVSTLRSAEVAFLAAHGWWAEDGKLQGLLESLHIRYTGSGVLASAAAMHKPTANTVAAAVGLHVPPWTELRLEADESSEAKRVCERLGDDLFIKPASGGGSLGARRVSGAGELEAILCSSKRASSLMACQYKDGLDVSVGLLQTSGRLAQLPILATEHRRDFYDYEAKHDASLREHQCPAQFDDPDTESTLGRQSRAIFSALKCSAFGRVDFLVDANGTPWFLEVNTLPGLSRAGNLATMAAAFGMSYDELVLEILSSAYAPRAYRP